MQPEYYHFLKELFPSAGAELLQLLQGAAENAHLLRSDFYTIRDWVEIAACRDEEVLHAILLLMLVALEEGSLCIEVAAPALLRRLRDFVLPEAAQSWAERICALLQERDCSALIGTSPRDHKPVILHTVGEQRFLYFQKYLRAELDFQREWTQRSQGKQEAGGADWTKILEEVQRDQPFPLDADQERALLAALRNNLAIISGGPGTGKTSIVMTLLRCLVRAGQAPERIALAAPTGRAAQRLTDALQAGLGRLSASSGPDAALRDVAATTLHHLLGYRPSRNVFTRHAENPVPADVVIVDEASMVGLVLMTQLLQALAPQTRLLLLGDKDQLPSVDAGAVLATLIGDEIHLAAELAPRAEQAPRLNERYRSNIVLLRTNHRSQQQIRAAADAINRLDTSIADRLPTPAPPVSWDDLEAQGGCWLLEQVLGTSSELRGFLQHWAEQAYFRSRLDGSTLADLVQSTAVADDALDGGRLTQLFALLERFRLLTLVRDGAWGCDDINGGLDQYLRPRLDGDARQHLFAGAPVLITRNDAARGLNNGDVGLTLRHSAGGLRVLFPRQDGFVAFPPEALPTHELGFALTVHKSQGSEYAHVMVVLPPAGGKRLLTKELVYTAITRAKSLAVICSAKEVLRFAVGRKIVRESGVMKN